MKRIVLLAASAVLAVVLAACGSDPVHGAYVAAGDGTKPDDLVKTTTFKPDDDLNVVVTLGAHSRSLPVYAVFNAPSGASYSTDTLEAGRTVGQVLLGLDWESQGTGSWPSGVWTVDVYIDNVKEKTLEFTVSAPSS
jgi:hypothetical protein